MAHSQKEAIAAFLILSASTAYTSSRYYTSAAFERPVHFAILTLAISGSVLTAWSRLINGKNDARHDHQRQQEAKAHATGRLGHLKSRLLRRESPSFFFLAIAIVARTLVFWRTIWTIQCSWDGVQTFLPFVLVLFDLLEIRDAVLPKDADDAAASSSRFSTLVSPYAIIALIWGAAATETLWLSERRTGAICPPLALERSVPFAQVGLLVIDSWIITRIAKVRQTSEDGMRGRAPRRMGNLFLLSAAFLTVAVAVTCVTRQNIRWNLFLKLLSVEDLVVDSMVVSLSLIAAIHLLGTHPPTRVALVIVATDLFVHIQRRIFEGTMMKVWASVWGLIPGLAVFYGMGALMQAPRTPSGVLSRQSAFPLHGARYGASAVFVFALVFLQAILMSPRRPGHDLIGGVIMEARLSSDQWVAKAKRSSTLREAVAEYKSRYGIPPPPHFDKWYEYAVSVKSEIIDSFDQIHSDLLPYWGTVPALIRERTVHLLDHPQYSFGGLIIEGGKVSISPHIHGTHRWMMEVTQRMIEPIAQHLPDMQLAFNLDDECRVAVPFDRLNAYKDEALKSRKRLGAKSDLIASFSKTLQPSWPTEYLRPEKADELKLWDRTSPWFSVWSKSPIFYEWIAPTCPPDAPANKFHWWNRKAVCASCTGAHMTDGFVADWHLSGNLCHQPDLAYLHGFLAAPSALSASHTLFPVFSQSRVNNFNDILYPSPWNFGDKVESVEGRGRGPWAEKQNSFYWRGASSDGYATNNAWTGFLRARFVQLAGTRLTPAGLRAAFDRLSPYSGRNDLEPLRANATFVGAFQRCDGYDCVSEHAQFYGSPGAEPPAYADFAEHWSHRHLMDLDGAAFSGRFVPFVNSTSLPYRAGLFRTWWEERLHAWAHFVPVDVRLGDDLLGALGYFGGEFRVGGEDENGRRRQVGDEDGERIASDGRAWANRVMRKEDMRVYMFRLLLEWGRIVDDRREELGFVV